MMTEEEEKNRLYIPELDPRNPKSGPQSKQLILRILIGGGGVCCLASFVLFLLGYTLTALIFGAIGSVLCSPFFFVSDAGG